MSLGGPQREINSKGRAKPNMLNYVKKKLNILYNYTAMERIKKPFYNMSQATYHQYTQMET